ncbi:nitrous oxide reductase accessory protein NosL [Hydrogenimonas sp. SS33]|uniref:nitrous oxide reductase accessory protein NosL n=1 Tax=Hydrogenimonas leucolamina TaxID=2954236 RepID=UPI00336BF546
MRRIVYTLLAALLVAAALQAAPFEKRATVTPQLLQSGPQKMWCAVCGMNLKMFYKTSHAVVLKDGSKRQYCSIRCLAADWPNIEGRVKEILVVDAKTQKLVDAKKAHYVVGSKVKGTMSMRSKIAFASLDDAKAFQKRYGGEIVDFPTAFKTARADLKRDAMMMGKKRTKMAAMGEKIYKKMCRPIDAKKFAHINELKAAIKTQKLCKPMHEKQLQAVALYLWSSSGHAHPVKGCRCCAMNPAGMESAEKGPDLTKQDKCPVCGMFIYKHPKWAAFIYYEKNGKLAHLAFDGVKDMMKFYFNPSKWGAYGDIKNHIKKMVVRDYYTLKPVWAKKAWYVVGSDVVGPMGNELVPFASKKEAESFMKDHHGKRVLSFDEISEALVYKLDE